MNEKQYVNPFHHLSGHSNTPMYYDMSSTSHLAIALIIIHYRKTICAWQHHPLHASAGMSSQMFERLCLDTLR